MWTDQRRVEQILLSLVDNAIKSTERGQVTIAADLAPAAEARNPRSPAASHRPADRGALVRLRVTDTGIGIAPEHLATVFEPFHQVDASLAREHERAGLSLAIARGVAELLGGEISVTSNWLKGSEFTVIIPIQIAV
jgi:signal transduction histidine kinase